MLDSSYYYICIITVCWPAINLKVMLRLLFEYYLVSQTAWINLIKQSLIHILLHLLVLGQNMSVYVRENDRNDYVSWLTKLSLCTSNLVCISCTYQYRYRYSSHSL